MPMFVSENGGSVYTMEVELQLLGTFNLYSTGHDT